MNRLAFLSVLILSVVLLVGCNEDDKELKQKAHNFLDQQELAQKRHDEFADDKINTDWMNNLKPLPEKKSNQASNTNNSSDVSSEKEKQ